MDKLIYLDNNSTAKIDPFVLEAMMPFLTENYGNASSSHIMGIYSKKAIEEAKESVAKLLNAPPANIIFTSGATEAINFAFKGLMYSNDKKHIITLETEHSSVLDTCNFLEKIGYDITYIPVDKTGMIKVSDIIENIRKDTLLISVMFVNNETGVIQDIGKIGDICAEKGIYFLCDATQAVGKIPIVLSSLNVDFLAFSGHKFHGPKGIGGLFVSNKVQTITPLLHGGGQEKGLRSGTINTPAIIGLGKASEIANNSLQRNSAYILNLRDELEKGLLQVKDTFVNGNKINRIFNVSNICFPGIESQILMGQLKDIILSNGSACTSSVEEPSHVLKAMHLNDDEANSSIRFSISKFNTIEEIKYVVNSIKNTATKLQLIN